MKQQTAPNLDLSLSEFYSISRSLENHHSIFYKFWELGRPVFTNALPTAAVAFDKKGNCINFLFNPNYWLKLTPTQRNFIISHECLHVILNHGLRAKDCKEKQLANIAMDVVINELLVDKFGYNRKEVDPGNIYCWLDTIFKDKKVDKEQSFEYYYLQLEKLVALNAIGSGGIGKGILVDVHDFLGDMDSDEIDKFLDSVGDSLTNEEKKQIKDMLDKDQESTNKQDGKDKEKNGLQAGTQPLGNWLQIKDQEIVIKRKWETIITRWMKRFLPDDFDTYEHWARVNRRLIMLPDDAMLPTEMELQEKEEESKILVYFFLDTSGSCTHLASRFWKAAQSLPKHRFDKKLFCFDTIAYPVSIEDEKKKRVRGGGGTSFSCMEAQIQKEIKDGKKDYPYVFCITDGYSSTDLVTPYPDRWKWFLTERSSKRNIPKTSKIYHLKSFE